MPQTNRVCPITANEAEIAILPGSKPGTALRICACSGLDGYVRLEHRAYNPGVGWYTQKSFIIPSELLTSVARELRKADCIMPRRTAASEDGRGLRIVPDTDALPLRLERRNA
jgi:hypothetical protein